MVTELEQNQPQNQNQNQTRPSGKITKGEIPLPPNFKCYREVFDGLVDGHGNWLPGVSRRVPQCKVCQGNLYPRENHKCPGYYPKYPGLKPMTFEERKALRRAAWEEAGDWDGDQYDGTTPGDADWMMHEAETGETRDQVVLEDMTEEEWIARRRRQLGHAPDYVPYFESDDFEDDGYEEE